MQRILNKLENCRTEVVVTFEEAEWKAARADAFKKLAAKVEIKGFRKGHAPEQLVKERVSDMEVTNSALDVLLQKAYESALKEEGIVPVARPSADVKKLSDTECVVSIIIPTKPEITLGEYKNLDVEHKELKRRLADNAELVLKDEAAEKGDTVVIDFEGFVDGKAFDGGKAENHSLELGSGQFVPGFEDQLIGAKAEEQREVKVTFPSNYPESLNDKDATFKVVVHEVKTKKVPELNDEFVADLDIKDVHNVEEYREFVKKDLLEKAEKNEKSRFFDALLDKIVANATVKIPEEFVNEEVENMFNNLKAQVEQNGLDMDAYFKITNSKEEDVKAKMAVDARKNIERFFVLDEVGKKEEIEVNDAAIELEIAKMAQQYGMPAEKIKEVVCKDENAKARFAGDIRQNLIVTFLLNNNK